MLGYASMTHDSSLSLLAFLEACSRRSAFKWLTLVSRKLLHCGILGNPTLAPLQLILTSRAIVLFGSNQQSHTMPPKKDAASSGGKGEGRGQNGTHIQLFTSSFCGLLTNRHAGHRPGFRTDTAISNRGAAGERVLQPWVPDSSDGVGASLEGSTSSGAWDQFAANERLFGLQTDYDENIYTTAINKSHPQYRERIAVAERKAREIERSAPTTAHVAEERVMDYNGSGGGDDNEEDKYVVLRHTAPSWY